MELNRGFHRFQAFVSQDWGISEFLAQTGDSRLGLLAQVLELGRGRWWRIGRCGARGLGRWRAAQSDVADVQCKEEPFEVIPGDAMAALGPASFNLGRLPMKLNNVEESAGALALAEQDSLPARQETSLVSPKPSPAGALVGQALNPLCQYLPNISMEKLLQTNPR
jgi:hypothetical protein